MSRILTLAIVAFAAAGLAAQTNQALRSSRGSSTVSPSVWMSQSSHRIGDGPLVVDIMILWRGSPGWAYRQTPFGNQIGGGPSPRDGSGDFVLHEGGLHLTANYNAASGAMTVLGERVELKGANVVFVDRVDAADGPVIAGTATIPPSADPSATVYSVLRNTPQLLDYLRCEAQISESLSHPSMMTICTEARLHGALKLPATITAVPVGPVSNRAAATAAPVRPERPAGPSQGSGSGVLSPAVVGGWFTSRDATGAQSVDLLVLWRGTPGWFTKGNSSGGSSGGGGPASARRGMTVRQGGLSLYAALEQGARTFQIDDTTKPLGEDNVVLVDDVDSPAGPRIVKTLRIDAKLVGDERPQMLMSRSPELIAFLRCDVKLTDPRQQATMDILCARYIAK